MLIYGHRGAKGEAPENTLPGFRHAIAIGLTAVEFDVQLTADLELVVIHDATLDRTTNGRGPVASWTLADIQALDARAQFSDWPERCWVPTLGEVLEVVGALPAPLPPMAPLRSLLVEIKRDTAERLEVVVAATLDRIAERGLENTACISSFDPHAIDIVRRLAPEMRRTLNGAWRAEGLRDRAIAAGCSQVDFDYTKTGQEHVDWARANGMSIVGWPCYTMDDLEVLSAFGLDAVGSDYPGLISIACLDPTALDRRGNRHDGS